MAVTTIINPNTQHQRWSKWAFLVVPGSSKQAGHTSPADFQDVRARFARMVRRQFGSTGRAMVEHNYGRIPYDLGHGHWWLFACIVETNHPHDPQWVAHQHRGWLRFFGEGFGPGTRMRVGHKLLAGDWQNGQPADQMIVMDLAPVVGEDPEAPDAEARGFLSRLFRRRGRHNLFRAFRPTAATRYPRHPES